MSRRFGIALVLTALAGVLALTGCAQLVRVETGERVTCTYGEVVTDTVKVVEVPANQAANYTVTNTIAICDRHKQAEALYAEAQAAILAADLDTAKAKLAEVIALDAAFARARTQLDAIDAGKKPVPDTGATTPTPADPGGEDGQVPVGPVANLAAFIPDSLTGYKAQPVIADVFTLSREYVPASGAQTDYLVIVVEQYKDAAAADRQIAKDVATRYARNVSTVSVAGKDVRFGTDGARFATLAWNENGILVVIEASSRARKPVELKSHLIALAGGIVK